MLQMFFRFIKMLVCLLIVLAISITRDERVMGIDLHQHTEAQSADTATITVLPTGEIVVNSTNIASDIKGYGGTIPLRVYVRDGVIDSIQPLPNNETPEFFDCAAQEILPQYKGKKVSQALAMNVDAVSGATFSSRGITGTMQCVLQHVAKKQEELEASPLEKAWKDIKDANNTPGLIATLIVSLMAAILPLFIKSKNYRMVQQVLNVAVLGVWTGTFINYTTLTRCMSDGISLTLPLVLIVLIIIAFVYPIFGRKAHYCSWCCPMGATQDLVFQMARRGGRKQIPLLNPSPKTAKRLNLLRVHIWMMLMFLSWFGITSDWMNYEVFSAFIWQTAQWFMFLFLGLTIILSIFMPRPYCRFLCPTGTLIK